MESGWNVWVWLVGVASRRWVWLVGVGGIYGCGSRRWMWAESIGMDSGCSCMYIYIDFLILLIPTPFESVLFLQQHPYFLLIFKNVFGSCIIIAIHCRKDENYRRKTANHNDTK